ncbi:MAG: tRNA pseudouridine(13) synthase TruD [Deltaproteobacteria bacterium]|nr:MAG: tRNA pseudouridine(13) synthase TruD [Deltaproteobacteria bacterium]
MRRLTGDLPPAAGTVKACPEDFEVEEVLLHPPEGEGEHLYLRVEKRGRNTREVVRALAAALGLRPAEVGVAGQKDRQAVTRQWLSVPRRAAAGKQLEGSGWRVLEAVPGRRKLRTGRIARNRFRIRVRGAGAHEAAVRSRLRRLVEQGVPNYFGPQRFGHEGQNPARGRALLAGTRRAPDRFTRRLWVSALQAELFNAWLDARIDDGLFLRCLPGDVLTPHLSRKSFLCGAPEEDTRRLRRFDVDLTGPIYGHAMRPAEGEAGRREAALLQASGLSLEAFRAAGRDGAGTRRPARIPLWDPAVVREGEDLCLSFALRSGGYATVVLAQLFEED